MQLERYELHAHARGLSSGIIAHVKRCLGFFADFMGGINDITSITSDDLRCFIVTLKVKIARANIPYLDFLDQLLEEEAAAGYQPR